VQGCRRVAATLTRMAFRRARRAVQCKPPPVMRRRLRRRVSAPPGACLRVSVGVSAGGRDRHARRLRRPACAAGARSPADAGPSTPVCVRVTVPLESLYPRACVPDTKALDTRMR
jgi:hypothetical protein